MNSKAALPVALLGGGVLLLALTRKSSAAPAKPAAPAAPKPTTPTSPSVPTGPSLPAGSYAVVTTNDPAPSGDLIIRESPSATAPQVVNTLTGARDGGAEKNGTVKVLNWNASADGVWAQIAWQGGSRRGPATGYARKAYLKPSATAPATPGVPTLPTAPVSAGQTAVVTTNDPAPSGDLIIRESPSTSALQVVNTLTGARDGGAEKNGTVQVLDWNADGPTGIFAKIAWAGGSRRGPAVGYAKKAYLRANVSVSGRVVSAGTRVVEAGGRAAAVACPGGCRLRDKASPNGVTLKVLPPGESVRLHKMVPGVKGDRFAPGPGGWALVQHGKHKGWVPSEWLKLGA